MRPVMARTPPGHWKEYRMYPACLKTRNIFYGKQMDSFPEYGEIRRAFSKARDNQCASFCACSSYSSAPIRPDGDAESLTRTSQPPS